jgi:ankyrin repeat protein
MKMQTDLLISTLIVKAMRGDMTRVRRVLRQGVDVNGTNMFGGTALLAAAMGGHLDMVTLLREAGAADDLFTAALLGDSTLVRKLLADGASCEQTDHHGDTPLMWAAYKGHAHVVRALLEGGAAADTGNKMGETALWWAAKQDHPVVVTMLREAGASGGFVESALLGEVKALEDALNNGYDVEARSRSGDTALRAAAACGQIECLRLLLTHGADPNNVGVRGRTALMAAVERGCVAAIHVLAKAGANIHAQDAYGFTALDNVRRAGREVVEALIQCGAEVNRRNGNESFPLIQAARFHMGDESIAAVDGFLDAGAEIDAADEGSGDTALMWAATTGSVEVVRLLLERGADPNRADKYGFTALIDAARGGWAEIVHLLLRYGADVNAESHPDFTAIYAAASEGNADIVRLLIFHGADVGGNRGEYALNAAKQGQHQEVINILQRPVVGRLRFKM